MLKNEQHLLGFLIGNLIESKQMKTTSVNTRYNL